MNHLFNSVALIGLITLFVATTVACGPKFRPIDDKEIENPALLVDSAQLGPDFTARNTIEATFGDRSAVFQAILQKTGDRLVLVALTPQGQRAFVLEQRGTTVSLEESPGVELPFSPWHILVDIHRTYFRGDGVNGATRTDGAHRIAHALEPMTDSWENGSLRQRQISAHGSPSAVVIDYDPGTGPLYVRRLRYHNRRVGYILAIKPL